MPTITPKQAFDAIKVLYPDTVGITKTSDPKTVQLLPPNDTPVYARMTFFAAVEIDWGTQTQYPTTVYQDATLDDVKVMPEAEFSDIPDFKDLRKGKLIGYLILGKDKRWYCEYPGNCSVSYNYCRIPVSTPELKPTPPEGWQEVVESDKETYGVGTPYYASLMYEDGKVFRRCYYLTRESLWRASGNCDLPDPPKYIQHGSFLGRRQ